MDTENQKTTSQIPVQGMSKGKSKCAKCTSCCKKFLAFVFSTLGLCCLMVSYTILGGYIFMLLETPYEEQQRSNIADTRQRYVMVMQNITWELNVFHKENWTIQINELMKNYTRDIYEAIDIGGWDGKEETDDAEVQWSFPGAMLYSITVITTIGYGHIAPKTNWGRVVTILYAIIGIPLTLLTITNLGGFMASAFRYLYKNIICGLCCICCKKPKARRESMLDPEYGGGGNNSDFQPLTAAKGSDSGGVNKDGQVIRMDLHVSATKTTSGTFVTWRQGIRRVLMTEDNKRVSVPIYVSLLLISGYIMAGAVLFAQWESDWDIFIGAYFCFVTLTTIGFGDFVPGTSVESWDSQEKLVLCALYLIFGLALIAMCFDLMQEEVKNKFRTLGRKMGLIKDKNGRKRKRNKRKKTTKKSEKDKSDKISSNGNDVPTYDSYLQRRGKSPLYDRNSSSTLLPQYNNHRSSPGLGSSYMSVNNRSIFGEEDNKLQGNFEDYDEAKRPILKPKYPSKESTPVPSGNSVPSGNTVPSDNSLRSHKSLPNANSVSSNNLLPNKTGSIKSVRIHENDEPIQITVKRAYTPEPRSTESPAVNTEQENSTL